LHRRSRLAIALGHRHRPGRHARLSARDACPIPLRSRRKYIKGQASQLAVSGERPLASDRANRHRMQSVIHALRCPPIRACNSMTCWCSFMARTIISAARHQRAFRQNWRSGALASERRPGVRRTGGPAGHTTLCLYAAHHAQPPSQNPGKLRLPRHVVLLGPAALSSPPRRAPGFSATRYQLYISTRCSALPVAFFAAMVLHGGEPFPCAVGRSGRSRNRSFLISALFRVFRRLLLQ